MYENDILLGGFVRRHIDTMRESELTALEALLEIPDNELADWLTGRLPIPPEAESPMLRRVRDAAGHASARNTEDAEAVHPASRRGRSFP